MGGGVGARSALLNLQSNRPVQAHSSGTGQRNQHDYHHRQRHCGIRLQANRQRTDEAVWDALAQGTLTLRCLLLGDIWDGIYQT